MAAADVKIRPQTLAVVRHGDAEMGEVGVGPEEFVREEPRHEEIQLSLVAAKKEAPTFSLVKTQEAVMMPMKIDELVTDDVKKEVSKESLTHVQLDKAAAELPKPSLVSIQEQVLTDVEKLRKKIIKYDFTVAALATACSYVRHTKLASSRVSF